MLLYYHSTKKHNTIKLKTCLSFSRATSDIALHYTLLMNILNALVVRLVVSLTGNQIWEQFIWFNSLKYYAKIFGHVCLNTAALAGKHKLFRLQGESNSHAAWWYSQSMSNRAPCSNNSMVLCPAKSVHMNGQCFTWSSMCTSSTLCNNGNNVFHNNWLNWLPVPCVTVKLS